MTLIKQVNASAILTVRQAVLRQGLPIEASIFDKDEDQHTAHFGAWESILEELVRWRKGNIDLLVWSVLLYEHWQNCS